MRPIDKDRVFNETKKAVPGIIANNPFYRILWNSMHRMNMNEVVLVSGRPGTGKSCFALRLMQDLDLEWNEYHKKWVSRAKIDHVVFSIKDLVALTTSSLPKGSVVLYDESGIESDNSSYMEMRSKIMRWVLQLWRHKNCCLITTLPVAKSLTIGIRRMANWQVETYGRKTCNDKNATARIVSVSTNPDGKEYKKYLRFKQVHDGFIVTKKMTKYIFPKPNALFEEAYNKKKQLQLVQWYTTFNDEMSFMKGFLVKTGVAEDKGSGVVDVYAKFKDSLSELVDERGKFSLSLLEKKLLDDKIDLSERERTRLVRLLRADSLNNLKENAELVKKVKKKHTQKADLG